jgi:methylthioribose-1-phosphate isomerase
MTLSEMDTLNPAADLPAAIRWIDERLYLLDQTRLPLDDVLEEQGTVEEVWQSIKALKVRGAPAIGVAAAYGLCIAMKPQQALAREAFLAAVSESAAYLVSARPTAVNLAWAVNQVVRSAEQSPGADGATLYTAMVAQAEAIHAQDRALCLGIGEHGLPLIRAGMGVLTHCNAGALATTGLGTATAPLYLAHARGVRFRVYADETRPLLQGARITSWELATSGLDVTLNTDNAAAHLMAQGLIDLVIVGTDRVAANGDVANKIGTLGLAILARHFSIPFYVACPSSTWDPDTACGDDIEIEERDGAEVTQVGTCRVAAPGIQTRNPAFDVTPARLVTGIITEKGIVRRPRQDTLQAMLGVNHD